MRRHRKPPLQNWCAFLSNHKEAIRAVDFFTVPTATFNVLYIFVVIEHAHRRIVHFNVTRHPKGKWIAQRLTEAFPFDTAPTYLIRDGDVKYGFIVQRRISALGVEDIVTTLASPWENAHIERVIGSIRPECLDEIIILNERHLRRLLNEYLIYYHEHRTHLDLDKGTPTTRDVECRDKGNVVALPLLGGLQHRYLRHAA